MGMEKDKWILSLGFYFLNARERAAITFLPVQRQAQAEVTGWPHCDAAVAVFPNGSNCEANNWEITEDFP